MRHKKHVNCQMELSVSDKAMSSGIAIEDLVGLFEHTHKEMKKQAVRTVDRTLVVRNWLFGWYIVEFEKQTKNRSEIYGKKLIIKLAEKLTTSLGAGYSRRSLDQCRQFYEQYQEIGQTLFAKSGSALKHAVQQLLNIRSESQQVEDQAKIGQTLSAKTYSEITRTLSVKLPLSWSQYLFLISISNLDERRFYELETAKSDWSLRELKRQFNTSLYERLALSRDKEGVKKLSQKGQLVETQFDVVKDPYVLEFLGIDEKSRYSETELETAIIDKLEHFLLELGKGFLFEARQKRFTFDEDHFFVDLVFYNRLLHCYVLIDLKIGELKHQDLGQMQMYVNYFDRYVKQEDEQPTIGIILCKKKKDSLVEITLPKGANIHAAKYQTYLPDKEALKKQLEDAQAEWEAHRD